MKVESTFRLCGIIPCRKKSARGSSFEKVMCFSIGGVEAKVTSVKLRFLVQMANTPIHHSFCDFEPKARSPANISATTSTSLNRKDFSPSEETSRRSTTSITRAWPQQFQ